MNEIQHIFHHPGRGVSFGEDCVHAAVEMKGMTDLVPSLIDENCKLGNDLEPLGTSPVYEG